MGIYYIAQNDRSAHAGFGIREIEYKKLIPTCQNDKSRTDKSINDSIAWRIKNDVNVWGSLLFQMSDVS